MLLSHNIHLIHLLTIMLYSSVLALVHTNLLELLILSITTNTFFDNYSSYTCIAFLKRSLMSLLLFNPTWLLPSDLLAVLWSLHIWTNWVNTQVTISRHSSFQKTFNTRKLLPENPNRMNKQSDLIILF